ncbi:anaerobic benzoate catabolism transcriptional regulator [Enhygromyxa salina]|uniref:Anaerobic benzoate catabolism transcriptional regulator n=1 Tax=Enhygromyxa salina TaxID=215803 RepID=A0A2S9XZK3_9BACT|nr:helix-turn-helix transcriptional regulator [Enhygromyxa salina]PRP98297.1 anaerobic benzoate catabolism transcriptional regulator [Enhygromyxa salina]
MTREKSNPKHVAFGRHLRALRQARALTPENLAKLSGLAVDTIRGLEQGASSPSLDTLRRLAGGLDMQLSTLFTELELGERELERELSELLVGRSSWEIQFGIKLLRFTFGELDAARKGDDDGG